MKFICNGLPFSEAVLKVSKACALRTTAPIMECIKISARADEVALFATDGELSMEKRVKAEVFEEGEVCVQGKLFADFIGKLNNTEITIQTSDKGIDIRYLDSGTSMQALSAEEFPKINLEISENSVVLKKNELKDLISSATFCCAADDSRPILKGCLLEWKDDIEITALDGYRMAVKKVGLLAKSGEGSIVCPARSLNEIARSITDGDEEITLYTQGGMMLVNTEGTTIVTRLYHGDFIKKENVIAPAFEVTLKVNRDELVASVERAAILIRGDKNNLVTLETNGQSLKVTSVSEEGNVSESIKAETNDKDIKISMNAKYLLEALKALNEEKVVFSFNSAVAPFIVQNETNKESLYLILPVRNIT